MKIKINNNEIPSDNTKVHILIAPPKRNKILKAAPFPRIYDGDKAKYYENLLNFYNSNFFGYGLFGNLTKYDPTTEEGLQAILLNYNYSKGNALSMMGSLLPTLIGTTFRGILPLTTRRATVGLFSHLTPYKIGEGAEAFVINNSPLTVGKITQVGSGEMIKRNAIPNAVPNKFVGYIKNGTYRLPTFVQRKMRILNEKTFPKYVEKLDKAMEKKGWRKVNDPNVQYRAYTNGTTVIDDIAPGNVGLDWLGRPKMVDFNMQPVSEWEALGFTYKKGGKLWQN